VSRIFLQTPTLKAFYELIDAPADITEKPNAATLDNPQGAVKYDHLRFRFPNSDEGVFDLSFEALPGQTIALVGPTGAGKTTALALLQRLRDPSDGAVLVDGRDIRDLTLASLRGAISVVFQDAGLFNRSIAENIRLGRPEATNDEVESAAKLAEAHEFIIAKPNGYEFVIGERGAALSGGERQRIAIARAILKSAPILILDEATSALDNETEARVKRALEAARRGRTTFIIAHRLSTVRNADLILVFEKGRIVEAGSFDELAKSGGLFARLLSEGDLRPPIVEQP
jgi:ATP-binding cassette subfamily B protein